MIYFLCSININAVKYLPMILCRFIPTMIQSADKLQPRFQKLKTSQSIQYQKNHIENNLNRKNTTRNRTKISLSFVYYGKVKQPLKPDLF